MKGRVLGVVAMIPVVLLALVGGLALLTDWRPSLNPFTEEEIDRTGPSVLQSLTEISDFHAASAYYETVVDLERDTRFVPGWISGERVLYVGKGTVDAVVDFSALDDRRVQVDEESGAVRVRLPEPSVGDPVLDLEESYVVSVDRGITNRFRGSDLEQEAQRVAVAQMSEAAEGTGPLVELAESNTVAMLEGLLEALGHEDVSVTFAG
ncbi:hypothetical protein BJF80_04915 [Serinicoccus sp. CUA-874]|uniref:DUF4230 domain-containing protein n=1 Tax=Serinicoccus sp. CUA-874 TaxID=1517939 RepID=UPI0009639C36|nr:DUF4230 domain-containing protein [Serinicoccus sp. CUA-874]OLT16686.1 hypothetical protein BJF80_04915 [Serinicoccus sp. CUA-874]